MDKIINQTLNLGLLFSTFGLLAELKSYTIIIRAAKIAVVALKFVVGSVVAREALLCQSIL